MVGKNVRALGPASASCGAKAASLRPRASRLPSSVSETSYGAGSAVKFEARALEVLHRHAVLLDQLGQRQPKDRQATVGFVEALDRPPNVVAGRRHVCERCARAGRCGRSQLRPMYGIDRRQRQRQRQDQEKMKLRSAQTKVHCSSSCQPAM